MKTAILIVTLLTFLLPAAVQAQNVPEAKEIALSDSIAIMDDNRQDEFATGQTVYYNNETYTFDLPPNYSIKRIGNDENWDPYDAVWSIKTPLKQYMVYLVVEQHVDYSQELIPLKIRDVVQFDNTVLINHACETDEDYYTGIFHNDTLIGLYKQDYENYKFIAIDSVKCVRCAEDPDYYHLTENYKSYELKTH